MMHRISDIVVDALATAIESAYLARVPAIEMRVDRGVPVQGDGDARFRFEVPAFSITAGEVSTENVGARQYVDQVDDDPDTVRITWRRGYATIPLQLDFYTADKTDRYELIGVVESLFLPLDENGAPLPEGLRLELVEHFDAVCRIVVESTATNDDEGADQGYARAVWQLEASTSILEQTTHTRYTRDVDVVEC